MVVPGVLKEGSVRSAESSAPALRVSGDLQDREKGQRHISTLAVLVSICCIGAASWKRICIEKKKCFGHQSSSNLALRIIWIIEGCELLEWSSDLVMQLVIWYWQDLLQHFLDYFFISSFICISDLYIGNSSSKIETVRCIVTYC